MCAFNVGNLNHISKRSWSSRVEMEASGTVYLSEGTPHAAIRCRRVDGIAQCMHDAIMLSFLLNVEGLYFCVVRCQAMPF